MTRITSTSHQDERTFIIISRVVNRNNKKYFRKNGWENQNMHFLLSNSFFLMVPCGKFCSAE